MKTIVYIDGFNLYYGCLKGTPSKWLDLCALADALLPKNDVVGVKYFTARVSARPGNIEAPRRQETYLRALATLPRVQIIEGSFLSKKKRMRLANPIPGEPRTVEVLSTEEKGSDVNLAAHLIHDAHLGRYEVAAIISNDSDLVEAIRIVTDELNLPVGVINPHPRMSVELQKYASFVKPIRPSALRRCQFPASLPGPKGTIRKPAIW